MFSNNYNNHRDSDPYLSFIHEKSATNIQKSYSILIPCWTLRFFSRLLLSALGYVTFKHKGKVKGIQVNYPSAFLLGPNDSRYLKFHINRQDTIAMPLVHYQYALQSLWCRVYNIRLSHPDEDIITYKDDLVSNF